MEISSLYSFLVHPGKNLEEQPQIKGTPVPMQGRIFEMMSNTFQRAGNDCHIDIAFTCTDQPQVNPRRNDIIELLREPSLDRGLALAKHLQVVTTRRSGLGLLFILVGGNGDTQRLYISRFPADHGIVAEESDRALHVEFLEQVFMKNAAAYKAAVYDGNSFDSDFWVGKATDKQVTNRSVAVSGYWIREFLCSDFKTTSAIGTRRLALAITKTMEQSDDTEVQEELAAAARLAKSLNGQLINMENFASRFMLSSKTRTAMVKMLSQPTLRFDNFEFSLEEFSKHVRYRSLRVDNGAMLTAPVNKFDECFSREPVADGSGEYRISTQGHIVKERLRRSAS